MINGITYATIHDFEMNFNIYHQQQITYIHSQFVVQSEDSMQL